MASTQEKEIDGGFTQDRQKEYDPGLKQSFDKDLNTQDTSDTQLNLDTQFSSISAPTDNLSNGRSLQEKASPEMQKLEHQMSKGMIALIMSALCVRTQQVET